VKQGICLC